MGRHDGVQAFYECPFRAEHRAEFGRQPLEPCDGHRAGSIDFSDLNWERRSYRATAAYGQYKLANLLFTAELHRRLREVGSPVRATAAHPGMATTNLLQVPTTSRGALLHRLLTALARDVEHGAAPIRYAALGDLPGGSYVGPGGFLNSGAPSLVGRSRAARDAGVARRLWEASEQLTGTSFPVEMASG